MSATATRSQPRANTRAAIFAILAISAAASLFLFWLIYEHPAADVSRTKLAFLPALNAVLNGLSATSLLVGYTFIRARKIAAHRASMITAFGFSTLFLISYILHHYLHGDVRYPIHAAWRSAYLPLLASHIILAVVALPMVLVTFSSRLRVAFPNIGKSRVGHFRSGSMSPSPASSPT